MKIADCHMHSFFSSDSEAPTEEMVKRAVELGLPAICLTDHYDMDYSTGEFQLDTPAYAAKIRELQEKYRDRIDIRFGVELGLQLHLKERMEEYVNAWPFDYVIGSMHVIDGKDPYYEDAFPDWTAEELYRAYFRATAENIRFFHNFQTLGHLDYVVRYCREKGKDYSYRAFADEIDTILKDAPVICRAAPRPRARAHRGATPAATRQALACRIRRRMSSKDTGNWAAKRSPSVPMPTNRNI